MIGALRAPTGEGSALRWLLALMLVTFVARVILAATIGLGIDEAYTVATARTWALSTYDHPPMAWWLAEAAVTLFGTEAPLAVRLPFILLFVATTWFAYDAGRYLYGPRAGLFAGVAINLAPVLGWTSGSMVLPDGPLMAALLAGLCCVARALFGDARTAARWWLLAGVATGFALLAKLHGVFLLAGTGLFILTSPAHRHWLRSPWPYLAACIALLVFSPVLIWNAQHDWISFAFQAGRAKASRFDLAGPFIALGGQALFLLPWVWGALILSLGRAAWAGPRMQRDWLVFCLAIGPIAVFTLITLTGTKTLFHWAAPGYLFGCIVLGRDVAVALAARDHATRLWIRGSMAGIALLFCAVIALASSPWTSIALSNGKVAPYPLIETQTWRQLRAVVVDAAGSGKPGLFAAGVKWHETARIDAALAEVLPVRCLCADPRGFGITTNNRALLGQNAIIVGADLGEAEVRASLGPYFESIAALAPVTITHAGKPVQLLRLYRGNRLRDPGLSPSLLAPFAPRTYAR